MNKFSKFIISVLGCEAVGLSATPFTIASITGWYQTLTKPALNPPNWVFGPVWTILYFLMGVALFIIWSDDKKSNTALKKPAINIFLTQLGLNFIWSFIFFGLQNPALAAIEIVLLLIAIYYTIVKFRKISPLASNLMIPYLLWVAFAAYLNISIMLINP